MNKREARDILLTLVFESEFNREKSAAEIYDSAREERGFETFRYIKKGLSDIITNREVLAGIIERRADGWKISRMAPVTRAILLVATYDMVCKSTACGVAINEAIELAKKYDDASAVAFINGILNSIAQDLDTIKDEVTSSESDSENSTLTESNVSIEVESTAETAENEK